MRVMMPDSKHLYLLGSLTLTLLVAFALVRGATDTVTVNVSVASQTLIDVTPNSVSWSNVAPGSTGSVVRNVSIENVGSNNITTIYAYTTYPASNPFGTGASSNYDAGNFLLIQNNATESGFFFANRVEYNDTNTWNLRYLKLPSGADAVGRFRIGHNEYFWALVGSGDSLQELCSNGTIYIGTEPHNYTNLGDIDLTDNSITWTHSVDPATTDGVLIDNTLTTPAELADYAIYIDDGCEFVALFKWANPSGNPWNADDKSNTDQQPLFLNTADPLAPGETLPIDLVVKVPYGVAAGSVTSGTLTILAE